MKIQLYDRVFLKTGQAASIVEIFDDGNSFIADIEKHGDIFTEEIKIDEIEQVM